MTIIRSFLTRSVSSFSRAWFLLLVSFNCIVESEIVQIFSLNLVLSAGAPETHRRLRRLYFELTVSPLGDCG